jgi:Uma2 family endonuclease
MNMLSLQPPPFPTEALLPSDQKGCEFVDGQWVEKAMGAQSARVGTVLMGKLDQFALEHRLGLVFNSEAGYQIFPGSPRIRKPDASVIRFGRLPDDKPPRGYIHISPDLALEVVSPNDLAEEIDARVMDFLRAGVKLFWVIYPGTRSAHVFRQSGSMSWLTEADTLSGEDVMQGFSCRIADLFIGL